MIKTKKELLEDIYNEVHYHKLQTELAYDSLHSKVFVLIKPEEEKIRQDLELKLAQLKNTIENDEKAMKRVMDKINETQESGEVKKTIFT